MKKGLGVLAVLALLLGKAGAQEASLMAGKLLGYDGKPMLKAHVHLLPREYDRKALHSVEVANDGSFEMRFGDTGLLYLNFTGVNHHELAVPILVEKPQREKLIVRLKLYEYADDLSQVKIIGDFNDFSFQSAQPMTRQADGTYLFEKEVTDGTFAYQILGAEKSGRSINGTQSNDFVYDNGGDYRSVVKVNNDKVKIVFDPKKLLRAKPGDDALVQFDNPNSLQGQFYALHREHTKRRDKYVAAARAYSEAHQKDMSGFTFDWSEELAALPKRIAGEKNSTLGQVLLIHYLEIGDMGAHDKLDKNLLSRAFAEIPATSPLWGTMPWLISIAVNWSGEPGKYDSYLNEALEKHPDRHLRATILNMKLGDATTKGDTAQARIYFNRMMSEFGDTHEAQWAKNQYDPNRAIMKGKQLPVFNVASLDQPGVYYTNESMKGTIYLLDFWAVWCGPCVAEMPNLHKAYEKFKDKNFEILSLSFDRQPEDVTKFRSEKWKMPWLHVFLEKGFASEIAKAFEVMGIPKPILVDGNTNTILATERDLRGEQLEKTLETIFAYKTAAESTAKQ